jgi:NADH dehydrogenase FAD-containing subunit
MWPVGKRPDVTLVDQNDRFLFKPLMYELLSKQAQEFEVAPEFSTLLAPYSVRVHVCDLLCAVDHCRQVGACRATIVTRCRIDALRATAAAMKGA